MKLPRFTIREFLLITVIVALGVALFYKRMEEKHVLELSYTEVAQIIKQIEPTSIVVSGGGGTNKTELQLLVPSATAGKFVENFKQQIDAVIDKGGWQRMGTSTGNDGTSLTDFGYDLAIDKNVCLVDFTLVDRKKADESMNKAYGGDYEIIRFLFICMQTR